MSDNTPNEVEALELELRKTELELMRSEMQIQESYVQEARHWISEAAAMHDPDEQDWIQIGPDLSDQKTGETVTEDDLRSVRQQCRTLGQERPTGRGLVRTFQKYVVSSDGLRLQISGVPDTVQEQISERWKQWRRSQNWRQHQLEIVKRLVKEGEIFTNYQVIGGELSPRLLNPDYITDPRGRHTWGIETDPKDVTQYKRFYYHTPEMSANEVQPIEADDMNFFKIETDSDVKRGLPLLYSLRKPINQYDTWLEYRMALNKARAAIVLLRKHQGTPRQVDNFRRSRQDDTKHDAAAGTDVQRERIYPGTKMDVPAGVDYEFMAPNVQASDVQADGRAVLLQVAAGASIAEFMVSADASNSNYASTMVSESPAVKEFEMWQGDVSDILYETVRKWLEVETSKGRLPEGALQADISFQTPRLTTRDPLEQAKANQIKKQEGVLSVQTWREEAGLDVQQEQERIDAREEDELYG